jgi:hypothetical protein
MKTAAHFTRWSVSNQKIPEKIILGRVSITNMRGAKSRGETIGTLPPEGRCSFP